MIPTNRLHNHFTEKQAGFLPALGRAALAGSGKLFNSFVLNGSLLKSFLRTLSRGAKGSGRYDVNGVLQEFKPVAYKGDSLWGGIKHGIGNLSGRAYNQINRLEPWVNGHYDRSIAQLNAIHPDLGKWTGRGLKAMGYGGVAGGLAELPFELSDSTDNGFYKVLHGANQLNPGYWLSMSEYSPINMAFNYGTPVGLALSGAGKAVQSYANGMLDAGQTGAMMAINESANQLGNLDFMDRLGFLIDPKNAAQKYRQQGFDAIARQMAQYGKTGDSVKDRALSDINRVA